MPNWHIQNIVKILTRVCLDLLSLINSLHTLFKILIPGLAVLLSTQYTFIPMAHGCFFLSLGKVSP